jgi:hypothetical protein
MVIYGSFIVIAVVLSIFCDLNSTVRVTHALQS